VRSVLNVAVRCGGSCGACRRSRMPSGLSGRGGSSAAAASTNGTRCASAAPPRTTATACPPARHHRATVPDMTSSADSARVRSWEPMDVGDLPRLRLLAEAAPRVEGDALARLATVTAEELGELVVWAWVFDEDRTHVLMVDHHVFDVWVTPGGRVDPGEDPLAAAARELLEETGTTGVPVSTSPAAGGCDRPDRSGWSGGHDVRCCVRVPGRPQRRVARGGRPARPLVAARTAAGTAHGASVGPDGRARRAWPSAGVDEVSRLADCVTPHP
jgi:ADP-ribose pyrophosphatase YjhB (NUDIX family)